ncbi:uncharacterized protein F4822DRAFT_435199 [Hypoxylon trugodes]|uniref:uncharacterized protein n=1 Tax=Hypoxylon trugodes TaxID=326681 RepID=UPI0021943EFC|nr:uncharacterized protein F4822DRAFT_435199 [Hypoxylon trugodes]KAI1382823.1 hypothetical protein F4822DRAFT_435199 [Hypoxylon trugodes]
MASFGQLINAFLKASQETAVGFANHNFDFAIVKYGAPHKHLGLSDALSKRLKDYAEDGPLHITARKLGALFQCVIPDVPSLVQAYGSRASEIAELPEVNPKASASHGAFTEHGPPMARRYVPQQHRGKRQLQ